MSTSSARSRLGWTWTIFVEFVLVSDPIISNQSPEAKTSGAVQETAVCSDQKEHTVTRDDICGSQDRRVVVPARKKGGEGNTTVETSGVVRCRVI